MSEKTVILLVEDEALIRMTEATMLREEGYEVLTAATGEKAIVAVERNPGIDLILMDIRLGKGIDGIQAAREIFKDYNIPVLFLSAHTEKQVVKKMEEVTSFGYVAKDSGIAVLDASIKMALKLHKAYEELRRKDKTLKKTVERFRNLFTTTGDSILILDQETGRIIAANPAACRLYGYTEEEFIAVRAADITAEPEETEEALRRSVMEIPYRLHRRKDGTIIPVEITGGSFAEDGRTLITAHIRDITGRKRTEGRSPDGSGSPGLDLSQYLDIAAHALIRADRQTADRLSLRLDCDPVRLAPGTAITAGLIAGELIANAVKHGFPDGREGEITVTLRRAGETVTLTVADNGIGFPCTIDLTRPHTTGFHLITDLITGLSGTFELTKGTKTEFTITFKPPETRHPAN